MSGSWSKAFFSSMHCVRACVVNAIFLWAGSNEHFLPIKAEICAIIAVSVRAFDFLSQQGRWQLVRHKDTSGVVAGQRLVAGLRLAARQRLVAGLRVGAGQGLFMYVEGSLFRLYWKWVYGSSEWRPNIWTYASNRSQVRIFKCLVLLGDKIYPEGGQIYCTLCTVPQFSSKDAATRRKYRKLNNHIRYYRETR